MIKFLRNIRKSLLSEEKTGKYIKYAIGEIVLVMIGILLALQVNNWNEDQKKLRSKSIYIDNLIEDLKADTVAFSFSKNRAIGKFNDGKYIMTIVNENQPIQDNKEFVVRFQNIGRVGITKKANNTFFDLQSSGNLKLFRHDSIVNAIRNYYLTDIDFWNSRYVDRVTEGFLPIVTDVLPFSMAEDILNSEIKENLYTTAQLNYDKFDVDVSDDDLELILDRLIQHEDFNFHLKNATRAHLLNTRIEQNNSDQAVALMELLKSLQK